MSKQKFKFSLNYQGIGAMLRSAEMGNLLMQYGESIAGRAGADFEAVNAGTRVIVRPANEKGEADNLKNNTLLKSTR